MTAPARLTLQTYGQTDRGLMRSDNEDGLLVDPAKGVFAVADGLGGLPEGAMASEVAIEVLGEWAAQLNPGTVVDFAPVFARINEEVCKRGREISSDLGIGTTLTAVHVVGDRLDVGHIGDTALVVFKPGQWHQLTSDHTMAQEMLNQLNPGENAYIPDYFNHTLTRCLGQLGKVKTDTFTARIEPGDRLLICSDGVSKTMTMDEVHTLILAANSPKSFVRRLIALANERGGPDNTTAIAIFAESA
ncbi:serine/threonine-protein phosphatase [Ruficoccus amylovorans]|uniref:Serine/threonine-protein phosphatase n=1 Tax=Ruficoccus amylovorans TaxID=1804625 RepID=A0A842HEW1_9BACT|nr:protein phosphatase 2C domain-containing protein [Ruficoccus amylovorans]MBC2594064.1 serine/threonine-protein phosphatase [Ruficoccus amylovorans]